MHVMREKTAVEIELIARARRLVPALRERAERADREGKVPDETIREMQEAGLFRALQPKQWDGYEVDPRTFFEIAAAAAVVGVALIYLFIDEPRGQIAEEMPDGTVTLIDVS